MCRRGHDCRIGCDAQIIPAVLGGEAQILDLGRATPTWSVHQRRAAALRDRGCVFNGCRARLDRCQLHHIAHWAAHRGPTDLDKGVHGFEFAFIIPADSPEYTRSPFGRVRYIIKATAYGAGRARSNIESWRDCFPVANPSSDGGPTPLTVLYNDLHPTVGLLSVACTSQNISVGGHVGGLVGGFIAGWLLVSFPSRSRAMPSYLPTAAVIALGGAVIGASLWAASNWMDPLL